MFRATKNLILAIAISLVSFSSVNGLAQEISADHLSAARNAIRATKATDSFDNILISTSAQLKNAITANNPDLAEKVAIIVDEEALKLAPRRGDLESEAARLFANSFSADELGEISKFFNSPAGSKYLASTPILARELGNMARIWAGGISRDLNQNVQKRLNEKSE